MPLRIALIGAPTSGKTALANQLAGAWADRTVTLVDDYVQRLSGRTDQAFSHYSNFIGNCQIALERFATELEEERADPDVLITCGTLAETTVYAALHALSMSKHEFYNHGRATINMQWLGALSFDTWAYDHAYYLPLGQSDDRWEEAVDQNIPEAIESLAVKVVTLPVEPNKRLGEVLKDVAATEDQRRGDSDSGQDGAGGGNPAGSVPDVQG